MAVFRPDDQRQLQGFNGSDKSDGKRAAESDRTAGNLFNLGKLGLGLYIAKSAVASSYGAAGSILVLLLRVYYSGLILYFGAEFTKVFAERYGSRTKSRQPRATSKRFASAA